MRKITFILIFSILFSCGNKKPYPNKISDFRPELRIQLNKLKKENYLYSTDTIASRFLKENCSKEELLQLLECEVPLLRVISFRTLIIRKDKDYFKILLEHLSDTTKVIWTSGDLVNVEIVADLLIDEAKTTGILTQTEKNTLLDSVLIKHSYLESFTYMIQEVEPKEKYYSIIKKRCEKKDKYRCGTQLNACFALSKFKKEDDLEFLDKIFQNLESPCEHIIFESIEQNPNQIYFPILKKYFNENIKKKKLFFNDHFKYYCQALASYKNKESLLILTELLNKKYCPETWYYEIYRENIFLAIHKYNNPLYNDLYYNLRPKMSKYIIEKAERTHSYENNTW